MREPSLATLSPEQLDQFRAALLANAESLYLDARLLMESGRHARAVSLALLGQEELAKLLPVWAQRAGFDVSAAVNGFNLHSHQDKLLLAEIISKISPVAWGRLDLEGVLAAMRRMSADAAADGGKALTAHLKRTNELKQRGFYVAWMNGPPPSPATPGAQFDVEDSRPYVNILTNYLLFAYMVDAVMTIVATGVTRIEDVPPESVQRASDWLKPHWERVKSYLASSRPPADLSTPPDG